MSHMIIPQAVRLVIPSVNGAKHALFRHLTTTAEWEYIPVLYLCLVFPPLRVCLKFQFWFHIAALTVCLLLFVNLKKLEINYSITSKLCVSQSKHPFWPSWVVFFPPLSRHSPTLSKNTTKAIRFCLLAKIRNLTTELPLCWLLSETAFVSRACKHVRPVTGTHITVTSTNTRLCPRLIFSTPPNRIHFIHRCCIYYTAPLNEQETQRTKDHRSPQLEVPFLLDLFSTQKWVLSALAAWGDSRHHQHLTLVKL